MNTTKVAQRSKVALRRFPQAIEAASRAVILGAALLCVGACATTTTFTSTWKAPDVRAIDPAGKTVAAVFISREEAKRRAGEDHLAADLTARGARGVAAYTIVPDYRPSDADAARVRLKEAGANAVVIMRVVGEKERVTYTPGYTLPPYYGGFGPYWGYGWGMVYEPGYLRSDILVSVETLIYSMDRDKLLWASTSRTANPKDLSALIDEVADATAREMAKQGLLVAAGK